MATHDVLHGIGVSAGTAAAPAAIVQPAPGVDTSEPGSVDAAADGARVREALARGEDPRGFAEYICTTSPTAVIVSNEVGAGIVPIETTERIFREAVGRALCIVAQRSETVTRVVCGIGVRIK